MYIPSSSVLLEVSVDGPNPALVAAEILNTYTVYSLRSSTVNIVSVMRSGSVGGPPTTLYTRE